MVRNLDSYLNLSNGHMLSEASRRDLTDRAETVSRNIFGQIKSVVDLTVIDGYARYYYGVEISDEIRYMRRSGVSLAEIAEEIISLLEMNETLNRSVREYLQRVLNLIERMNDRYRAENDLCCNTPYCDVPINKEAWEHELEEINGSTDWRDFGEYGIEPPELRKRIKKLIENIKDRGKVQVLFGVFISDEMKIVLYPRAMARSKIVRESSFEAVFNSTLIHETFHAYHYALYECNKWNRWIGKHSVWSGTSKNREIVIESLAAFFEYCWCGVMDASEPSYGFGRCAARLREDWCEYKIKEWPYSGAKGLFIQESTQFPGAIKGLGPVFYDILQESIIDSKNAEKLLLALNDLYDAITVDDHLNMSLRDLTIARPWK